MDGNSEGQPDSHRVLLLGKAVDGEGCGIRRARSPQLERMSTSCLYPFDIFPVVIILVCPWYQLRTFQPKFESYIRIRGSEAYMGCTGTVR